MSDLAPLVDEYHALRTRSPNARVFLGLARDLGRLPDPSAEEAEAEVAQARSLLARLEALDRSALSFDEALDADLAELQTRFLLHRETFEFNGRTQRAQQPTAGDDIGDGIFQLFINDPRPDGARLEDVTARLEQTRDYLEGLLGRLDTPLRRWVAVEQEKISGLPHLFATVRGWAEAVGFADLPRLEAACEQAEAALAAYGKRLAALPTTTHLHMGRAAAEELIRLKGIDRSPESLRDMARDFLAETSATIEELRGRLVGKYGLAADTPTAELHAFLNKRYRVDLPTGALEDILVRYQAERERILAFIRERRLFPVFEAQDMKIMRTPGFMAPSIPAGAMMPPPPLREGTRTSLVYLTLSEELRDEHTELSIPGMMIHEGIPGHHLQLATASTHASVVRRLHDAMEHAEGWTTMLEDYMLDVGYMGDLEDEARFCGKRDISRIGARVAIDLFFMTGDKGFLEVGVDCDLSSDDPFVAAGNLLQAVTGFVPGRVQAELNWYSSERGYPLSYLTGNRMVWDLKRRVQEHNRGRLEGLELDRVFHRVYLQSGNMPVSFLPRVFAQEGLLPAG